MIAGLLLAAGSSRRLGRPKQLLPLCGRPLLEWPLAALRQYAPGQLIVVLGHEAEAIAGAVDLSGFDRVVNPLYAEGLSTSLRSGLARLHPEVTAVIVAVGDQPLVTANLFRLLETCYMESGKPIIATDYGAYRGVPMLLDRTVWPLIDAIAGDQGARALLTAHAGLVATVPIDDKRLAIDVDTEAQYALAVSLLGDDRPLCGSGDSKHGGD